jgi:hypothetical protein
MGRIALKCLVLKIIRRNKSKKSAVLAIHATAGHIVLCPELRDIYRAFGGDGGIELIVTPGKHHEMDIPQLLKFLSNDL